MLVRALVKHAAEVAPVSHGHRAADDIVVQQPDCPAVVRPDVGEVAPRAAAAEDII